MYRRPTAREGDTGCAVGIYFELRQTGASGAEGDSLDDAQQAGTTKREAPQKPVQVDKGLTPDVIPRILSCKSVRSCESHDCQHPKVDEGQETNEQVSGPGPVFKKKLEDMEEKENAVE